ncbi:MAG: amidase [Desulfobacterales bacterium]|jgi:amidase|nr:amidase [Desulfobacterales bacterium]MBT7697575.1 amidase [Desulfobacterales bacterium]
MANFKEYDQYDALGLAGLVKQGQVTSVELCEEAIERIEKINPKLNAVVTKMYEEGRQSVRETLPEGPFTGVPFLLKDLMAAYAGVPLTSGCKALKSFVPGYDSEMVVRFKKAGLVILGKTNTPEFGLMGITEPELFGPCRNPWNINHTPGGSSGGSASAVASGMVPMASGGDGGGSIRIPSSYCGLFGLKPSRGRNPTGPEYGNVWQGAVQEHVLTRSVRDSASLLDITQGPDTGAPYKICPPDRPYIEELERDPGRLKIAFNTKSPIGTPVHTECVRAVENTARLLEDLGHDIEEAQPDIDGKDLAQSYMAMYFGEVAADIDELEQVLGRKARPRDVEPVTWTLGLLGRTFSEGFLVKALRRWDHYSRKMGVFFRKHDLYLTPTTAYPPAMIGELQPKSIEVLMMKMVNTFNLGKLLKVSGIVDQLAEESLKWTPFTQLSNLCGLPAMSVPLHWTSEGLPTGVQFIGSFGDESTLLRLAGQLEKAKPWFHSRPPLSAE